MYLQISNKMANLNAQFKILMDLSELLEVVAIEPPVLGNWIKQTEERHSEEPIQRRYHSAIIHKSSLFIYGGILKEEPQNHLAQQCLIYRFNISTKIWTRTTTHFLNNNSFSYIYAHSTIIYNNMMYLFGGKNHKTDSHIIGLWCLNLQSYNWKRQELKGYSPIPRENASMVLHQRSSIVLYGGRNNKQNLNDIHIYRIQNKLWVQVEESSYDIKLPCRLKPALCSYGDHLYLFGGQRMISDEAGTKNILLNDFYQLKFINKPMNSRPDVWIKQIITNYGPTERVASFVNINEKYLMLWGGSNMVQNRLTNEPGFWLYNLNEINWIWVKLKNSLKSIPNYGSTINYGHDRCFVYGQYLQQQCKKEGNKESFEQKDNRSGLIVFQLDMKDIDNKLSDVRLKPRIMDSPDIQCFDCEEQAKTLGKIKFNQFSGLKESIEDQLSFIYSAFGLLMDNALILGAKEVRVVFHHTFKQKYCLIEDNGLTNKLWLNNTEFINDMLVMRTYVQQNIDVLQDVKEQQPKKINPPQSNNSSNLNNPLNKETKEQKQQKEKEAKDKEMEKQLKKRKRIAKQNFRKRKQDRTEYSRNIKLGALRIGNHMIFISRYGATNDNRRVFVIERAQSANSECIYRSYYYILQNGILFDQNMQTAKRYIDDEYKAYLKIVTDRKELANNFLFITDLKQIVNQNGQTEPELKESARHNDVFCCERKQFQSLQDGILSDSIDISLKNYLALLYLKSDQMKISLIISDHRTIEINNSQIFDKIDVLVKSDRLIDLMTALDLSNCNIIEVYYNKTNTARARDLNRKTNTTFNFFNGVLFYHKNRLISRYRFQLGEINKIFKNKLKNIQQTLLMFGFIEIKDEFAVNIFKTSFIREDLLQEINHRLKFVEKYAQRLNRETKEESSVKKLPQDRNEAPKKRFKPNDQGREDIPNNSQVINID